MADRKRTVVKLCMAKIVRRKAREIPATGSGGGNCRFGKYSISIDRSGYRIRSIRVILSMNLPIVVAS